VHKQYTKTGKNEKLVQKRDSFLHIGLPSVPNEILSILGFSLSELRDNPYCMHKSRDITEQGQYNIEPKVHPDPYL